MTCEVKKILHFTAVFYEHSVPEIIKEPIFLQFGKVWLGLLI